MANEEMSSLPRVLLSYRKSCAHFGNLGEAGADVHRAYHEPGPRVVVTGVAGDLRDRLTEGQSDS